MDDSNHEEIEIDDQQVRDFQRVQGLLKPRLEQAKRAYGQAITSLWIGNAGAAIATLSFIGASEHGGSFPHALLIPLTLFVAGLIFMGVGTIAVLVYERNRIRNMEEAESILDMKMDFILRPSEDAGLTLKDWRTRMACAAALCFILGCVTGLLELLIN